MCCNCSVFTLFLSVHKKYVFSLIKFNKWLFRQIDPFPINLGLPQFSRIFLITIRPFTTSCIAHPSLISVYIGELVEFNSPRANTKQNLVSVLSNTVATFLFYVSQLSDPALSFVLKLGLLITFSSHWLFVHCIPMKFEMDL